MNLPDYTAKGDLFMLYRAYQMQSDLMAGFRFWSGMAAANVKANAHHLGMNDDQANQASAGLTYLSQLKLHHERPDFGIKTTKIGSETINVDETIVLNMPFAKLVHFRKEIALAQPKVLLIAPLSGHFATLSRDAVSTFLPDHDVYVSDWKNARDVPESAGHFGIESSVDYINAFMDHLGSQTHLVAICQAAVPALISAALASQSLRGQKPASLSLIAGPIDASKNPTKVNKFALRHELSWFERCMISDVPGRYGGAGRLVYPGFMQIAAFMSMNIERHHNAQTKLMQHLAKDQGGEGRKLADFYREYLTVMDIPAEFYLETVERVFQRYELASGQFVYKGETIDLAAITKIPLMTVEGGRDDVCGRGQTEAALALCSGLSETLKHAHFEPDVGHLGVFSGQGWRRGIYPELKSFIEKSEMSKKA